MTCAPAAAETEPAATTTPDWADNSKIPPLPNDFPGVNEPSLALANPQSGKLGLLTLEDILGLKLDADWVVLSACNTAAGDGTALDVVSGLDRGFFYAGTRALLVTHWPVESVSARLLVTGLFDRQAKDATLSRAHALRQSMLALMTENAGSFAYADLLFWAPYALVGDGGARHCGYRTYLAISNCRFDNERMKRHALPLLHELLGLFPCVALIGVRQCGRTTLLQELLPDWRRFDLEKMADYENIARDPDLFLRLNAERVVIDEGQLLPALFPALRVAIDSQRKKPGRFVISGSSSPELLSAISESLAGRIAVIEMGPFSWPKPAPCRRHRSMG
jgi:hypothetical protein